MEQKRDDRGGGRSKSRSNNKNKKKSNNERRLGGRALSLHAFANAKSAPSSSAYNPSLIKKRREFYKNAKFVSKFKKSIKCEGQSAANISPERWLENVHENENENKKRPFVNKRKKGSQLDMRKEFEKKQAEAEKEKMEREAVIQAEKQERARAEARRKAQRENMFKKTRSGQPVMKYRIEHLLQGILEGSN